MLNANKLCVTAIVLGGFLAGMPKAQAQGDQQVSVAEAARKAREQKKDAAKPATVITNDTLEPETPATTGATAAPGTAGAGTNQTTAPPAAAGSTPAASSSAESRAAARAPQDKTAQQAAFKALKRQIAEKQIEVDLAQRVLSLANDDFYSHPDFSKNDEGKSKLEALKSALSQKQQELEELKAKLPADAGSEEKPEGGQAPASAQPPAESQSPSESPVQPDSQPQQP